MNYAKFANAVLYLLQECPSQPGILVLVKLVFFSDYEYYRKHLRSITGVQYVAMPNGPVIDEYKDLFARLVADGFVAEERVEVGAPYDKRQFTPAKKPVLDGFDDAELEVLRHVARTWGGMTSTAVIRKSHDAGPWKLVWDERQPNRLIPYSLFRWTDNLPTEGDLEAAAKDLSRPAVRAEIEALNAA